MGERVRVLWHRSIVMLLSNSHRCLTCRPGCRPGCINNRLNIFSAQFRASIDFEVAIFVDLYANYITLFTRSLS